MPGLPATRPPVGRHLPRGQRGTSRRCSRSRPSLPLAAPCTADAGLNVGKSQGLFIGAYHPNRSHDDPPSSSGCVIKFDSTTRPTTAHHNRSASDRASVRKRIGDPRTRQGRHHAAEVSRPDAQAIVIPTTLGRCAERRVHCAQAAPASTRTVAFLSDRRDPRVTPPQYRSGPCAPPNP